VRRVVKRAGREVTTIIPRESGPNALRRVEEETEPARNKR